MTERSDGLTHLDAAGAARMVDVAGKEISVREASARSVLVTSPGTAALLAEGRLPKGDAIAIARIAAISAAKRTPELIPLCHHVALSGVTVDIDVDAEVGRTTVVVTARAADRTGVEMEALVGASIGALALYDLVKAVERGAVVERTELVAKTGGVRGDYHRDENA